MRTRADLDDIWADSWVVTTLTVECGCGERRSIDGSDIEFEAMRRKLSVAGWRFNGVGTHCLCPKCGPKKYPELYKPHVHYKEKPDAGVRDNPRVVRRVSKQAGKQVEKEVRKVRRVRGS